MARVIVLGAGVMGLAAAYRAAKAGHAVTLLEAAPEPGGMAAHFDLAGLSIERFYHFVCKPDQPTFDLLAELGIADRMRWRTTTMGYFMRGRLYRWGDPIALLRFPHLSLIEKIRYGLLIFISTRRERWDALESIDARTWIEAWSGKSVYQKLWRRLFDLKFHEHADNISAQWIWTRIKRLGRSRRSLLQEELGYIEGGSQTLVDALTAAFVQSGGTLRFREPAKRIHVADNRVTGVATEHNRYEADFVISTVPTPYIGPSIPDLPAGERQAYERIANIGIVCVVLKLRRSVSPHFWINVVDGDLPITGIIEFTNLRAAESGETVIYVPYYMPTTNPLWARSNETFIEEVLTAIQRINPKVAATDVVASYVGRLKHAQPICPPGFRAQLPPVQTSIAGLQIADTCFYYPEDRGIAESVRLGQEMATRISSATCDASINERGYVVGSGHSAATAA